MLLLNKLLVLLYYITIHVYVEYNTIFGSDAVDIRDDVLILIHSNLIRMQCFDLSCTSVKIHESYMCFDYFYMLALM